MKKKFSVNLMVSVFFAIMIYIFSVGADSANAECIDVTQDPCYCDIFDVPYDDEGNFLYNLYRRNQETLDRLRGMEIQIDSCNLDYQEPCISHFFYEDCLYFKHAIFEKDLKYGFKKEVKVGDTISINDFDNRDTLLIKNFGEIESFICNFRIIVDYYSPNVDDYFEGTILFDSYYKGGTLNDFEDSMVVKGYWNYDYGRLRRIPVFDYSVNINNDEKQSIPNSFFSINNDELIIRLKEFENINQVEIYDLLGICQIRAQIQGNETVFDISKLTSGMYIIRVGSHFSKFIKE